MIEDGCCPAPARRQLKVFSRDCAVPMGHETIMTG